MKKLLKAPVFLVSVFLCSSSLLAQVPNAPTNLVVTPINTGGMIQFTAPTDTGGSAITNYEYSTDNGANWVTPSPAILESPLIISSGLTNCTSYQIKLRAVNSAGSGTSSAVATLVPGVSTVAGINWTTRTSAADNRWQGVTYGNGLYVAVASTGTGGLVMTSPDGITWTSRTAAANNQWYSVAYGKGLFAAVANSGAGNRVMTSLDGINWTSRTSAADNNWESIAYGNGLFVAVATSGTGNRVMTSTDGVTWTSRNSASNNNWRSVTFGNGRFVAVANSGTGNRVMTSTDGITWTSRTSAADNNWESIAYGNGLFVAVATSGTGNRVMTSDSGTTWTTRTSASNNDWRSVTWGNGLFVAVSYNGAGNRVMTSPDGITWTSRTSATNNEWYTVTYGAGRFVALAVSGTGNRVMTSSFSVAADAPVITSASLTGSTATVNFTQSSSVLAPAITNYQFSTDDGSTWTALSPAATASPLTIPNLPNETTSIRLRAVNSEGVSCASSNVCFFNPSPAVSIASSDADNIICSGTSVTFTATPTYGGTPSYQWKLNGNNVGTNSATYTTDSLKNDDVVNVVMTSTKSCISVDTAVSNSITSTVVITGSGATWIGTTSTNWSTGSNWCGGSAPLSGSSITIPAGRTNYPVLSGDVSVADLSIDSGSTLNLNGNRLTITGSVSGTGTLVGSSTSSLEVTGSGALGTLYFSTATPGTTNALQDLIMNRTSSGTITLGNTLNVYRTITPTAGTLNTGGYLVLKSNSSGTARIAAGSGTYINGEVTVERYIPNTGRRYRLLTPTVNTSGSIRLNWMENGMITSIGTNNNPNPGYGTQITGQGGNASGFDASNSNQPSLYLTTNGITPTYTAVTSATGTLDAKTGYFLFIRGDRSVDMNLANTNVPPSPVPVASTSTTLRTKGTLVTGTVTSFSNALSNTADALNLITNPYPSPINWASVYAASSNISSYYTMWDPSIGYRGGFVTVSTSGVATPSPAVDDTSSASNIIQLGQAFFVQSTGTGTPSVTIAESHKTSGNSNSVFAPVLLPAASLKASIYYKEGTGFRRFSDGVLSQMDNNYTTDIDARDAVEIPNWDENLAIAQGGKKLAIEQRQLPKANDTLSFYISNMKNMSYELQLKLTGFADPTLQAYLIDRLTGTQTIVKNEESTIVPFTVTSSAASKAADRFYVVFRSTGALPIRIVQFKASAKDKGVQVNWQVEEDESVEKYELEHSKDQRTFSTINTQVASGLNKGTVNYSHFDSEPVNGNNFYRLKVTENSGKITYSQIERVSFSGSKRSLQVYPNPLTGTELQVKLDHWPAGNYRLSITDVLGRTVYQKEIENTEREGSLTIPVRLSNSVKSAGGVFWLKLEGEGIEEVRKVVRM